MFYLQIDDIQTSQVEDSTNVIHFIYLLQVLTIIDISIETTS